MSNDALFLRSRERRPASRCVINLSEGAGGGDKVLSVEQPRSKEEEKHGCARGVRKSIFAFRPLSIYIRHVGGEKGGRERTSGEPSHLVPQVAGARSYHAEGSMPRREGILNPPETRTLRPVPAKDPRTPGPLNIDAGAKTSRRPFLLSPCFPLTTSRVTAT